MNICEALLKGTNTLEQHGCRHQLAKQYAEELLLFVLHYTRAELLRDSKRALKDSEACVYQRVLLEFSRGKPLEYITRNAVLFGYNFFVNESVLIPRIDSEILIEQALLFVKDNICIIEDKINNGEKIRVLDACCGSGCLGISFFKKLIDDKIINSKYYKMLELSLLDISSQAIQIAKINANSLLNSVNVRYIISNVLLNGFGMDRYDIILYNPPYIKTDVIPTLDKSVKDFEPLIALDGGVDGLKFYKSICNCLKNNLYSTSAVIMEIGFDQGNSVDNILKNAGFRTELKKDYASNDRCIICRLIK